VRSPVQESRLRVGDRVRFSGTVRTVIGLSGTVVRLADTGGTLTEVTLAELVNASDFERVGMPPPSPLPPASPLDGLPEAAVTEALWWEQHIVEVLRGIPPDALPGTVPKPQYDPGLVSLTRRERAKAAELTAAGRPVTASAVKQRRRRYQAGGLAAMADHRVIRRTPPYGRADQRVIEAMSQAICEATDASTRTASYIFWRAGQILDAAHGAGSVELPSRAGLYRLFSALSAGRHTTGSARTATRAGAEASDTLKYFSERIPATFIYAGISLERSGLLAGTRGEQIAGRFGIIRTQAFAPGEQWRALIAALEDSLRLHRHRPGTLTNLDGYLHQRTRGMIGSLLWLIRSAAIAAVIDGTEKITRKSLDALDADLASQPPAPAR
jgi:hypothetical protein